MTHDTHRGLPRGKMGSGLIEAQIWFLKYLQVELGLTPLALAKSSTGPSNTTSSIFSYILFILFLLYLFGNLIWLGSAAHPIPDGTGIQLHLFIQFGNIYLPEYILFYILIDSIVVC